MRPQFAAPGLLRLLGPAYAVAVMLVGFVWLAARSLDRPFSYFSREPALAVGEVWYAGFLSNVGVLLWTVAATASLLGWWQRRHRAGPEARLLLWAGLLTTAELFDDLFMLHDAFYPMLGIPEQVVVVAYGLSTVAFAVVFRHQLGRPGVTAIGLALALLAASVGLDRVWQGDQFLEDTFKFLGIVTWASYFVLLSAAEPADATTESD